MLRWFIATAILVPPLLLLMGGTSLLIAAPLAWGAASAAKIPDWMTSFSAVSLGLPAFLIATLCLRSLLASLKNAFTVSTFQLSSGVFLISIAAIALTVMAFRIPDTATYEGLVDSSGNPSTSPGGFLFITLATAAIAGP